jgi:hypothetical protein
VFIIWLIILIEKLHLELLITIPLESLLISASIAIVGHGCFHSALVVTSNMGLQNKHHIANFQWFSWYVNSLALSARIVSTTLFNGANKGMVAVTDFTDLSSTRVEMVKFVFRPTIVTSALQCPLPITSSIY